MSNLRGWTFLAHKVGSEEECYITEQESVALDAGEVLVRVVGKSYHSKDADDGNTGDRILRVARNRGWHHKGRCTKDEPVGNRRAEEIADGELADVCPPRADAHHDLGEVGAERVHNEPHAKEGERWIKSEDTNCSAHNQLCCKKDSHKPCKDGHKFRRNRLACLCMIRACWYRRLMV